MSLYRAAILFFVATLCPYSSNAQFFIQAGPTFSRINLYRESASMDGFNVALGHHWTHFDISVGFQGSGETTRNFYGEEFAFAATIVPDSRDRVDIKSEYIAIDVNSPSWHRIRAKAGIGVGMVQTRVTSLAVNVSSKAPITDYSFNNTCPIGRVGLELELARGFTAQILVSIARTRAAPDTALVSSFGGGRLTWISIAPSIRYAF